MITIDLSGNIALVTGASKGIGRAIALSLAQAGCDVAINYLSDDKSAKEVSERVRAAGRRAILLKADIRNYDEVERLVKNTVSELGTIDFLINNAGVTSVTDIDGLTPEEWKRVIDTNLSGAFYCARECAKIMKQKGSGKIINISSAAAVTGRGGGVHYAATKGGLNSLTRALARELADHNILVNGVASALIETDIYYERYPTKQARKKLLEFIPLKRIGKPQDVANICVFLCSGLSDFISGETILADGGRTYTGSQ